MVELLCGELQLLQSEYPLETMVWQESSEYRCAAHSNGLPGTLSRPPVRCHECEAFAGQLWLGRTAGLDQQVYVPPAARLSRKRPPNEVNRHLSSECEHLSRHTGVLRSPRRPLAPAEYLSVSWR